MIGLDISHEMLRRMPHVAVRRVQADAVSLPLADGRAALVLSTFGSLSYACEPILALTEASRILAPGGRMVVMVISRWSFRRLLRGRVRKTERYGTGNFTGEAARAERASVTVMSSRNLRTITQELGLELELIQGQSVFRKSRVLGTEKLAWRMSVWLGERAPDLGHCLILMAKKP